MTVTEDGDRRGEGGTGVEVLSISVVLVFECIFRGNPGEAHSNPFLRPSPAVSSAMATDGAVKMEEVTVGLRADGG